MNNRSSLDSRLGWAFGKVVGNKTRRPRALRPHQIFEHLEARCLLAVTPTTQGLPVVGVEGAEFGAPTGGVVAKFTSDDVPQPLSNFSAPASSGVTATPQPSPTWSRAGTAGRIRCARNQHVRRGRDVPGHRLDPRRPASWRSLGRRGRERGHDRRRAADRHRDSHSAGASRGTDRRGCSHLQRHRRHIQGCRSGRRSRRFYRHDQLGRRRHQQWRHLRAGRRRVFRDRCATFAQGSYPVSVFIKDSGGSSATAVTTFTITATTPVVAADLAGHADGDRRQDVHGPHRRLHRPEPDRDDERVLSHHQLGRHDDLVGHGLQLATGTFIVTGSHTYAEDTTGCRRRPSRSR